MKLKVLILNLFLVGSVMAQPTFLGATFFGENYTACYNMQTELDKDKNLYTAGVFSGPVNFNPGGPAVTFTGSGFFICKYAESGNIIWARCLNGAGNIKGVKKVLVDHEGSVVVYGYFDGAMDCDPGPAKNHVFGGSSTGWNSTVPAGDLFLLKLDINGNFVWFNQWGNNALEKCGGIAIDPTGNIYLSGSFPLQMDLDPGPGVYTATLGTAKSAIFIEKLKKDGQILWATYIPASTVTSIESLVIDKDKNFCIAGKFSQTIDLDHGHPTVNITANSDEEGFIAKYDTLGTFIWAAQFGGGLRVLQIDDQGSIYGAGIFKAGDFDPGAGTYSMNSQGQNDIFINKLNAQGNMLWTKQFFGKGNDFVSDLALDPDKNIYITGHVSDSCDVDPSSNTYLLNFSNPQYSHIFLSKLDSAANFVCAGGVRSTQYGGIGASIKVDQMGQIYLAGKLNDHSDVNMSQDTMQMGSPQYQGVFIGRYHCGLSITGLEELSTQDNYLTLYPNPATDKFYIRDALEIRGALNIYNSAGALVLIKENVSEGSEINIEALLPGLYFIEITSGRNRYTQKIIIQ